MTELLTIAVKRVHDIPAAADGARFLVDRLWPRGVSKGCAARMAGASPLGS
ncbi:MAG: hypothetical protein DI569_06060 [Sphingopyxis macrogoltabida]|uniref:DUF488 domain-containing protein n=1 Tax=Sphingopyxis macrogoltabida TaxID=33050 RepID=A0A2W5L107_SPHMC|nr:MAG: hypothetical protein DI569_06060 [Sphingopyxis macrogoltabida]